MVERGGLENRCVALRHRGFESHPLRHATQPDLASPDERPTLSCYNTYRDPRPCYAKSTGEANWRPESATTGPVIGRGAGAVERARLESV